MRGKVSKSTVWIITLLIIGFLTFAVLPLGAIVILSIVLILLTIKIIGKINKKIKIRHIIFIVMLIVAFFAMTSSKYILGKIAVFFCFAFIAFIFIVPELKSFLSSHKIIQIRGNN